MNSVLVFCSEKVISLFDKYELTQSMISRGRDILVHYRPATEPLVIDYRVLTINIVFLLALIMAVPEIKPKLRIKIMILGMIFLFPVQVLFLVIIVYNYYAEHIGVSDDQTLYSETSRTVLHYAERVLDRLNAQLVPLVIWAGLFFYYKWHDKLLKKKDTANI